MAGSTILNPIFSTLIGLVFYLANWEKKKKWYIIASTILLILLLVLMFDINGWFY